MPRLEFAEESLGELDEMAKRLNAASRAEVLRRAVALFKTVLEAERRGAKIFIREPDGTQIQIMPLF